MDCEGCERKVKNAVEVMDGSYLYSIISICICVGNAIMWFLCGYLKYTYKECH